MTDIQSENVEIKNEIHEDKLQHDNEKDTPYTNETEVDPNSNEMNNDIYQEIPKESSDEVAMDIDVEEEKPTAIPSTEIIETDKSEFTEGLDSNKKENKDVVSADAPEGSVKTEEDITVEEIEKDASPDDTEMKDSEPIAESKTNNAGASESASINNESTTDSAAEISEKIEPILNEEETPSIEIATKEVTPHIESNSSEALENNNKEDTPSLQEIKEVPAVVEIDDKGSDAPIDSSSHTVPNTKSTENNGTHAPEDPDKSDPSTQNGSKDNSTNGISGDSTITDENSEVRKKRQREKDADELKLNPPKIPRVFPKVYSFPRSETKSPIDSMFNKIIGLMLTSLDIKFSSASVEHLSDLGSEYFSRLIHDLHTITEIQRRRKPLRSDLSIMLKLKGLPLRSFEDEIERGRKIEPKVGVIRDSIERETIDIFNELKKPIEEVISPEDASAPFFYNQTYEISELVPLSQKRKAYVPSWLPPFPPDHTHKTTPQYIDIITDPKKLREKLVEEGKLSEMALQRLMGDEENAVGFEVSDTEGYNESDVESILSEANHDVESVTDNEAHNNGGPIQPKTFMDEPKEPAVFASYPAIDLSTPPPPPKTKPAAIIKTFNIEGYAKKRLGCLKAREEKIAAKQKDKLGNVYLMAEKFISPYSTEPITESVSVMFSKIIDDEYISVLKSIKVAEKKKVKKIAKLMKTKQAQEEEKKKQVNSEEFNFNYDDRFNDDENENENEKQDLSPFEFAGVEESNSDVPFTTGKELRNNEGADDIVIEGILAEEDDGGANEMVGGMIVDENPVAEKGIYETQGNEEISDQKDDIKLPSQENNLDSLSDAIADTEANGIPESVPESVPAAGDAEESDEDDDMEDVEFEEV